MSTIAPGITLLPYNVSNVNVIDPSLLGRLVKKITEEHGFEPAFATRIMDQALGFLRLCAADPAISYSPSPTVDIGWHTFILFTRDYAAFCERWAGHFIHHSPIDDDSGTSTSAPSTTAAMKAFGIEVDEALWNESASCSGGRPCESHACRSTL
ncbi:glycine-rich domain-containing protein [Amycolatopsis vancoresmycina]|uniref:Uncharacterized protein n=1 Tax=Amycolatopsis vancoresmycina DSM 44592 TaxID=1292037 RepID=R1HTM6_9PSEU|nr:hypothetical protein [Amycolatopsis vancoresmycina]EOD63691.1 hypothetical protein H480_35718 [Amycolatopsis vancoresmycina DSM 44592]